MKAKTCFSCEFRKDCKVLNSIFISSLNAYDFICQIAKIKEENLCKVYKESPDDTNNCNDSGNIIISNT